MTDINQYISEILSDLRDNKIQNWTHIVLEIESNLTYVGSSVKFYNKDKCIDVNSKSLSPKTKFQIIQMHKVMDKEPDCYEKWNKSLITLENNGTYEVSFTWDQELQKSWDNAK